MDRSVCRNASSSFAGSISAIARAPRSDPFLELERPGERLLHGDLLVDREPDQERERLGRDEPIRVVRVGEVERGRHAVSVEPQMIVAIRSAIAAVVRFVFARGIVGMTEASTTRRPSTPRTRHSESTTSPIAHVPAGWK